MRDVVVTLLLLLLLLLLFQNGRGGNGVGGRICGVSRVDNQRIISAVFFFIVTSRGGGAGIVSNAAGAHDAAETRFRRKTG